jgi:glycosyltransferase involved in cell wall biosynthesis
VEVVGFAPDVRDEFAAATAVVVPLRIGTGTKNKVLQPLAMARPVVTTSIGNEGLEAVAGRHLEVADDVASFAALMVRLQRDPARRCALGTAGRTWVVERYGLPVVVEQLERTLQQAMRRAPVALQ